MLSKLLGPDASLEAAPIEWRLAGTEAPEQSGRQTTAHSQPAAVQAHSQPHSQASADAAQMVVAQQHRIQQLEAEVESRSREAYQKGMAAGQSAGAQQAQALLEPVMAKLARTLEELAGLKRKVRAEAEEDAVRLSIAVARKVLHREVTVDADALLGLVKAAMQRVDTRELSRVRLHPDDIPVLERHFNTAAHVRIEVLADASLERGAVLFETSRGNLDASIGTQLAEIERGFIDIVRRSRDAF